MFVLDNCNSSYLMHFISVDLKSDEVCCFLLACVKRFVKKPAQRSTRVPVTCAQYDVLLSIRAQHQCTKNE